MSVLGFFLPFHSFAVGEEPCTENTVAETVAENIEYPTEAATKREEGLVYVSFTLSEDGKAENITIEQGISEALDNEATNAVENMELTNIPCSNEPGKVYLLPIKFVIK